MKLLIQLVREILHLSGKSQGNVREFPKPLAVAAMKRYHGARYLHLFRQVEAS